MTNITLYTLCGERSNYYEEIDSVGTTPFIVNNNSLYDEDETSIDKLTYDGHLNNNPYKIDELYQMIFFLIHLFITKYCIIVMILVQYVKY